ncbi:MAG: TIGR04211 family SH3 domain-containing protein [Gammaproteobacteria bacterium]
MKKFLFFISFFILGFSTQAETVYVTDRLKLDLRSGESSRYKIVKMLSSGTPLTLIEENPDTGYSKVMLKNGMEGYILTRYTSKQPASRWLLEQATQELEKLRTENSRLTAKLNTLNGDKTQAISDNNDLSEERDRLSLELNELRQTAANAIQLKQQRDRLNERVVNIERENQQLKREKQTLEDSANQDWFLYGGLLAFAGIFFGLLIPKISWHRKTSSWDTF